MKNIMRVRVKKISGAKRLDRKHQKYLEKEMIPAGYVADFIDGKVPPKTVHDYIFKIRKLNMFLFANSAAAGMTAGFC